MNSNLITQFGKMCPDYAHPALVDAAAATVERAEKSPGPTKPNVSFVEAMNSVAAFYEVIEGQTSSRSFPHLGTSGLMEHGHFSTLNISALHSADNAYSVCLLDEILEPNVAPKYFLSPRACRGILRRAKKRGRTLPPRLEQALVVVITADSERSQPNI
jgi:hypothetical protein